jgi:hypothetical protein
VDRGSAKLSDKALPRDLVSLGLSLLLHVLPVLLGLIPALAMRMLPKPPIEFELLPPKPKPRPPAPPPAAMELPPPQPPSAEAPQKKPPGPGPAKKNAQRPAPPLQRMDLSKQRLSGLGPSAIDEDVGLRVLLHMTAIRPSIHRPAVEALLHAFPDTHILAAGTELASVPVAPSVAPSVAPATTPPTSGALPSSGAAAPGPAASPTAGPVAGPMARALVEDVDALLIETADPRDISATVFYAVPKIGGSLVQKLSARRSPRWDPRTLTELPPRLLAFGRADLLGQASAAAPPDARFAARVLTELERPGPAVYVEITNLKQRLRLRNGLPTPLALRLALSADPDPELRARAEMTSPEEAAQLATLLPGIQRDLSARLFWLGLGSLLNGLKIEQREKAVEVHGRLPRGDTSLLLMWVQKFLPPPDRFLDPPPPPLPPPPPPPPPDLGDVLDGGAGQVPP